MAAPTTCYVPFVIPYNPQKAENLFTNFPALQQGFSVLSSGRVSTLLSPSCAKIRIVGILSCSILSAFLIKAFLLSSPILFSAILIAGAVFSVKTYFKHICSKEDPLVATLNKLGSGEFIRPITDPKYPNGVPLAKFFSYVQNQPLDPKEPLDNNAALRRFQLDDGRQAFILKTYTLEHPKQLKDKSGHPTLMVPADDPQLQSGEITKKTLSIYVEKLSGSDVLCFLLPRFEKSKFINALANIYFSFFWFLHGTVSVSSKSNQPNETIRLCSSIEPALARAIFGIFHYKRDDFKRYFAFPRTPEYLPTPNA